MKTPLSPGGRNFAPWLRGLSVVSLVVVLVEALEIFSWLIIKCASENDNLWLF